MTRTLTTLAALLILAAILTATVQAYKATAHRCTDTTHYTCDGVCSCDGLECN